MKKSASQLAPLHFRRIEIKYVIPDREVSRLVDRLLPYVNPDPFLTEEGKGRESYPVTSLYFDSIDLHSLKEKDAGLLARRKVRLRTYHDSFSERRPSFLEIKRRNDVIVSKDRLAFSLGRVPTDLPSSQFLHYALKRAEASEAVATEAQLLLAWYNLHPTAFVQYERFPFVAKEDSSFRITFDRNLKGIWKPHGIFSTMPLRDCNIGWTVLEVKFNHAIPQWFHAAIQDYELQRNAFSKYALVVQSLTPRVYI